eukprot:TRINITY_DN64396_c0_g1_i1.p1 TRINITY_DN64396_c0_g1~~TRINITY_DN64396_c0_g1_i1.p1  ORF type:complete len:195 (-),score=30.24 TRINITY_DN64396_c0_g1_i1:162-746(-)
MAWDMGFNIQFTQRIEKEERSFLAGIEAKQEQERLERQLEKKKRRSRRHSSRHGSQYGSECGSSLSMAGSSTLSRGSLRDDVGSCLSGSSYAPSMSSSAMRRSKSEVLNIPEEYRAVSHFPVVDKDLFTARVRPTNDGTVPKMTFKPTKVKAMWWPGKGHFVDYKPDFKFEEPPAWTPADILKDHGAMRGRTGH